MRTDDGKPGWRRFAGGLGHGRGRHRGDQARLAPLLALLLAGGCSAGQGPEAIGSLARHIFGPANEGRADPPGAEAAYPNLGTIPPRPVVPEPAVRDALTAALVEERQRSRNPLDPERRPEPVRPAGTAGDKAMPMRAPGPPPLARAPAIPWDEPAATAPASPAAVPAPAAVPEPAPAPRMDTAPPAPPPADLLAPRR